MHSNGQFRDIAWTIITDLPFLMQLVNENYLHGETFSGVSRPFMMM